MSGCTPPKRGGWAYRLPPRAACAALMIAAVPFLGSSCVVRATPPKGRTILGCTTSELRAHAQMEGDAGSIGGFVIFTNSARTACSLGGYPQLALYHAGKRLPAVYKPEPAAMARSAYGVVPTSITLRPGQRAATLAEWRGWCGQPVYAPVLLQVTLPGQHISLWMTTGSSDPRQRVSPVTPFAYCHPQSRAKPVIMGGPVVRYPIHPPPPLSKG